MKKVIFAVGDSIETACYSSWLAKKVVPVTQIPTKKTEFQPAELRASLGSNIQFFPDKATAAQYTKTRWKQHDFDDRIINSPAIFCVEIESVGSGNVQFKVTKIISATVPSTPTENIEVSLNMDLSDEVAGSVSSSFFSASRDNTLLCTRDNFNGDFRTLQVDREALAFIFAHDIGLKPPGQENSYELPRDVLRTITQHVLSP